MNKKQYLEDIKCDGQDWLDENAEYYDNFDDAYYDMEMTITGSDNGSYYCNAAMAAKAVADIIWDEEVVWEVQSLGYNGIPTELGPETCDVIIRCALLPFLYDDLEEYFYELKDNA